VTKRELSSQAKAVKEEFIRLRGFWVDEYDEMAILCPEFLERLVATGSIVKKSSTLSPKLHHLVAVALDASVTHLFDEGTRLHMRAAFELGATKEEMVEVIQILSFLGLQSQLVALPIVIDLLDENDVTRKQAMRTHDTEDENLKERFIKNTGAWSVAHDMLLGVSKDYFPTYLDQLDVPYQGSALDPRERALVLFAANVSITHLTCRGIRESAEAALASGCSGEDLIHVLRLASSLGLQSCVRSFPILLDELDRLDEKQG